MKTEAGRQFEARASVLWEEADHRASVQKADGSGLLRTVMPICISCTQSTPYLYTVYESEDNLRLEQCVRVVLIERASGRLKTDKT